MEKNPEADLASCSAEIHQIGWQNNALQNYLRHKGEGLKTFDQTNNSHEPVTLWNKIFKTSLFRIYNINCRKATEQGSDENLVMKYFAISKVIYHIKDALYNYVLRSDSLMGRNHDRKTTKASYLIENLTDIADFFDENKLWENNTDYFCEKLRISLNLFSDITENEHIFAVSYKLFIALLTRVELTNITDSNLYKLLLKFRKKIIKNVDMLPIPLEKLERSSQKNSVTVVFAVDDNYCRYLPVTIQSIIDNSNDQNFYHIIILEHDVSILNLDILKRQISNKENFGLDIVSLDSVLATHKDVLKSWDRYTAVVHGRCFIPEICADFDRVIYAEADMIFNRDIAALMDIDLGNNFIAASIDLSMNTVLSVPTYHSYTKERLFEGLKQYYCLSGFVIFNIQAWNQHHLTETYIELIRDKLKESKWVDQDAINIICKNKIFLLEQSWNICPFIENRLGHEDMRNLLARDAVMEKATLQYKTALSKPETCFHYATKPKPWKSVDRIYDYHWWHYCRKTEIYEMILSKLQKTFCQEGIVTEEDNLQIIPFKNRIRKYSLFGLSVFKSKVNSSKNIYYLLGMRVLKIKKVKNSKMYYIFGIKFLKVKTRYKF